MLFSEKVQMRKYIDRGYRGSELAYLSQLKLIKWI